MSSKFIVALISVAFPAMPAFAQQRLPPHATLIPAAEISLPGPADSNSPFVWNLDGSQVQVFTSIDGQVQQASGPTAFTVGTPTAVAWVLPPPGGSWMESVVRDQDVLYGYYHSEVTSPDCDNNGRVRPRIGAARSTDEGRTWEDLGVILESSELSFCDTPNQYDDGGVGDFSVILDADRTYLYVLYSAYGPSLASQGVSIARMAWADRDEPEGALAVWQSGLWLPASASTDSDGATAWTYPAGTPIYPARRSWHSADGIADAFWGPSIHWNTYLRQYVMLLNHTSTVAFNQEGIYVGFTARLDDPGSWTAPQKVLSGGGWYPEVLGLDPASGTDKEAGQEARFYMTGHSSALIRFERLPVTSPLRKKSQGRSGPGAP